MPLSNPIMNLKKHLHLQETMVFTIFTYFYSGFLQVPSNAQLRLSEDCRPHLQANCAPCMCVYPGLGCNLVSIGWFWIIDIDVSRNDYNNDASFNWCDLAFQGLYASIDMLAICHMMSWWIGGPWNLNRLNLTASARAPHHGAHPLQHCAALFCPTCLGHGGQHLVTTYPHWLWLVVEPPL